MRSASAASLAELLDERRGTAEQFASAFAVMADSLGYRVRVVVGYLPGRVTDQPGVVEVSSRHAHAWPEVLFEGLGWVPFEPSPLDRRVVPADPAEEPTDAPATDAVQTAVTEEVADQQGSSPVTTPAAALGADGEPGSRGGSARSWRVAVVAVGLSALAALLVAPAAVVWLKERRRRRRTGTPGERIAGAWAEALDRLAEVGLVLPRSVVAEEVADRAVGLPTVPPAATAPLAGLAALANRALRPLDPLPTTPPRPGAAPARWRRRCERPARGSGVSASPSTPGPFDARLIDLDPEASPYRTVLWGRNKMGTLPVGPTSPVASTGATVLPRRRRRRRGLRRRRR